MIRELVRISNPCWIVFGVKDGEFVIASGDDEMDVRFLFNDLDLVVGVIDVFGNLIDGDKGCDVIKVCGGGCDVSWN